MRNLLITLTVDNEPPSVIELWKQLESSGTFYFGGLLNQTSHCAIFQHILSEYISLSFMLGKMSSVISRLPHC